MDRRKLLKYGAMSMGGLIVAQTASAQFCPIIPTPDQPEGPFYPISDQVDKDADLVTVEGRSQAAEGQVVFVEGVVSDENCTPIAGVLVEIWQACVSGRYNHSSDPNDAWLDPNFQYWGRAVTDEAGFYRFRTIVPGAYQASADWRRPPHIHFKVSRRGYRELTTQMYFKGEALNQDDLILQDLSKEEQEQLVVEFAPTVDQAHPVGTFNIQLNQVRRRTIK